VLPKKKDGLAISPKNNNNTFPSNVMKINCNNHSNSKMFANSSVRSIDSDGSYGKEPKTRASKKAAKDCSKEASATVRPTSRTAAKLPGRPLPIATIEEKNCS